jgi:AraC-like DNA-binding protein
MGINNRSSQILDRSSTAAAQVVGLDPLSSVLRTVRLRGAVFFLWEVSSPLTTTVPRGERFAPVVLPGSQQIVSYHVIVEGACWGGLIGEPPIRLRTGDVLLVPRGDAYVMGTSAGACRQARVDEKEALGFFRLMATGELPFVIEDGGGGPDRARVVCGFLGCDVRPFNPLVAALPAIVRLGPSRGDNDRLRRLTDYAIAEARHPGPGSGGVLTRLGELMFVEVIRRCLAELSGEGWPAGLRDPVVGRCLALLHRRPADPWTLASLARAVAVSRSGLARRFTESMGEPPIRYLTRWRLQLAADLLRDASLNLETVAHRVGYGSATAFSRSFKRIVGMTPGEWRHTEP